jgi:hypothetical protein
MKNLGYREGGIPPRPHRNPERARFESAGTRPHPPCRGPGSAPSASGAALTRVLPLSGGRPPRAASSSRLYNVALPAHSSASPPSPPGSEALPPRPPPGVSAVPQPLRAHPPSHSSPISFSLTLGGKLAIYGAPSDSGDSMRTQQQRREKGSAERRDSSSVPPGPGDRGEGWGRPLRLLLAAPGKCRKVSDQTRESNTDKDPICCLPPTN